MAVDTESRPTVDATELAKAIIREAKIELATKDDLEQFVTKDEFTKAQKTMNRRLDRIEATLNEVAKAVGVKTP